MHILCAVVVAGTGIGIAFFLFMANRAGNLQALAVTIRHVVLADWIFTTPAVTLQLVTGLLLMRELGYSFTSTWFLLVIALFIFIGCCWIPVVFIQYRLRMLAAAALATGVVDDRFKRLMQFWTVLGIPAFIAILVVFWLMVYKPFIIA